MTKIAESRPLIELWSNSLGSNHMCKNRLAAYRRDYTPRHRRAACSHQPSNNNVPDSCIVGILQRQLGGRQARSTRSATHGGIHDFGSFLQHLELDDFCSVHMPVANDSGRTLYDIY
ncbi:hypothetical protein Vi05172_g4331 [Venturia inaequalis]|nr:hypothetical protein Vi05172_g4331 [Venturia inaequalis]